MVTNDGLDRWLDDLRHRLANGDLAMLDPIDIGDGTGQLPSETTIRIMLNDLDDLDSPQESKHGDEVQRETRRHRLLDDFRRLRELIG